MWAENVKWWIFRGSYTLLCDKLSRFRGLFCLHLRRVFTLQMEAQTSDMGHNLCISYLGTYFAVWRKSSSSYTPFHSSEQSELLSVRYQWTRHVTVTVSSNVRLRFSPITLTSCAKYTSVWVVKLIRNVAGWNVTFLLLAKILDPYLSRFASYIKIDTTKIASRK